MRPASARIGALHSYPLKSARGLALERAKLGGTGFDGDRHWMLVTAEGRFLTQREAPRLALLQTSLDDADLRLWADGLPELRVPRDATGSAREVRVWSDDCAAWDLGDHCATALSRWLGRECRLLRFDATRVRASALRWTDGLVAANAFSDGFPLLLIGSASLADLNRRIGRELPMDRFRPNIVVDGLDPYGEDQLYELHTGAVTLRVVKPCTRCSITTNDQALGEFTGDEPLRTLRSYRYDAALHGVTFGQNLIVIAGQGRTLRVGESLRLSWRA